MYCRAGCAGFYLARLIIGWGVGANKTKGGGDGATALRWRGNYRHTISQSHKAGRRRRYAAILMHDGATLRDAGGTPIGHRRTKSGKSAALPIAGDLRHERRRTKPTTRRRLHYLFAEIGIRGIKASGVGDSDVVGYCVANRGGVRRMAVID